MVDNPERSKVGRQEAGDQMMAPGDEAPPGAPGTGEDICPKCAGSSSSWIRHASLRVSGRMGVLSGSGRPVCLPNP